MRMFTCVVLLPFCFSVVFGQHLIVDSCKSNKKQSVNLNCYDNKIDVNLPGGNGSLIEVDGKLLSHNAKIEFDRYLVVNVISSPGTSIRMEEVHVFAACSGSVKEVFYCVTDSNESLPGGFKYNVELRFDSRDRISIVKRDKKSSKTAIDLMFDNSNFVFCVPGAKAKCNGVRFNLFGQKVSFKNGKWDYRFD